MIGLVNYKNIVIPRKMKDRYYEFQSPFESLDPARGLFQNVHTMIKGEPMSSLYQRTLFNKPFDTADYPISYIKTYYEEETVESLAAEIDYDSGDDLYRYFGLKENALYYNPLYFVRNNKQLPLSFYVPKTKKS